MRCPLCGIRSGRVHSRYVRSVPVLPWGGIETSESPVMRRFAAGLRYDFAAVRAGLTEEWINGPVEGIIHKLKLLKRQGYERANFDLLRTGMLAA